MLGNTLTSYRRLIIRDDPQAASKYIADYIIGAASRSSLAHIRQVTNGCAQSVSRRSIPLLNDRSCLVCLPAAALFSSTSTSFNDTSLARYRFAMWSPSIWYELFALRHLSCATLQRDVTQQHGRGTKG
jgi:hypothetical protein